MKVKVLFFARLREEFGTSAEVIDLRSLVRAASPRELGFGVGLAGLDEERGGNRVGRAIAARMAQDGFLTEEDLAQHTGEWGDPISTTYRGVTVYETVAGRRLNSSVLLADATHTRADLFVTLSVVGALIVRREIDVTPLAHGGGQEVAEEDGGKAHGHRFVGRLGERDGVRDHVEHHHRHRSAIGQQVPRHRTAQERRAKGRDQPRQRIRVEQRPHQRVGRGLLEQLQVHRRRRKHPHLHQKRNHVADVPVGDVECRQERRHAGGHEQQAHQDHGQRLRRPAWRRTRRNRRRRG